jgi:hypothetical protein
MIGIVSAIILVLIIILTETLAVAWQNREYQRMVIDEPYTEIREIEAAQFEALHAGPKWVDREAGVVQIPIDLAIERYAEKQER